jgi:hypothetical protein
MVTEKPKLHLLRGESAGHRTICNRAVYSSAFVPIRWYSSMMTTMDRCVTEIDDATCQVCRGMYDGSWGRPEGTW